MHDVFINAFFGIWAGNAPWQDGLRRANEIYYVNLNAIGEQHTKRVQGFAATYAGLVTYYMAKFVLAVSSADAALKSEEAICCGLTAPPLINACLANAHQTYWAAVEVASWQFGQEFLAASTAYYSACELSEQAVLIQWQQQDDIWFINAKACNPPDGVIPDRSWVVAGQEPTPPQYVEGFL